MEVVLTDHAGTYEEQAAILEDMTADQPVPLAAHFQTSKAGVPPRPFPSSSYKMISGTSSQ